MEWLSWSNAAYMAAIIIGGGLTFAATKYRGVLKEGKKDGREIFLKRLKKKIPFIKFDISLVNLAQSTSNKSESLPPTDITPVILFSKVES